MDVYRAEVTNGRHGFIIIIVCCVGLAYCGSSVSKGSNKYNFYYLKCIHVILYINHFVKLINA